MATTAFGVNHPLAVKLWSKTLYHEMLKDTLAYQLMGDNSDAVVQVKGDLSKDAGDTLHVGLRVQLSGAGVANDDTLEGQEEAMNFYRDSIVLAQLRHAVRSEGKMSEQRVPYSMREEAMLGLKDWWQDRVDTAILNQLSGNTGQTDTKYTGGNATLAPTSTAAGGARHIFGVTETTENSLSASASGSNNFQLTLLDKAVTIAKTVSPYIRPARFNGKQRYICILHPYQVHSLKTDATANRITWYDIHRAKLQGGDTNESGIFARALGEYNGVVLLEDSRVPLAPSTTTVRRAIFCGAQSAALVTGKGYAGQKMSWVEDKFDYGNQLGVSAGMIFGVKKLQINGSDLASIVISTHAEAP